MAQRFAEEMQIIPASIQYAARAYVAHVLRYPASTESAWRPVTDALWRIAAGQILVGPFASGLPGHDNGEFRNIGNRIDSPNLLREYYVIEHDCSRFGPQMIVSPSAPLSLAHELSTKLTRYRDGHNLLRDYVVGIRRLVIETVPCIYAVLPASAPWGAGNCRVDHRPTPLQCHPHIFYTPDHYEHFTELSDCFS